MQGNYDVYNGQHHARTSSIMLARGFQCMAWVWVWGLCVYSRYVCPLAQALDRAHLVRPHTFAACTGPTQGSPTGKGPPVTKHHAKQAHSKGRVHWAPSEHAWPHLQVALGVGLPRIGVLQSLNQASEDVPRTPLGT